MIVCLCHGISDRQLREELALGARSFDDLQARTGVASCCRACERVTRDLVEDTIRPAREVVAA